ncbi:hypothetical protein FACS189490_04280 [Clostridia bacterium]|nr:hypothetical protein FACS189490_04280 [Clostridia bacterium]
MPGDGGGLGANKTDNRAICYQDIVSALTTELAHQTGTHGQLGGQLIVEQTEEPAGVLVFAANQRDEVRDLGAASGALQAQPGMKQQTFVAQETNGTASPRSGLTGAFGDVAGTLDANYHKGTGARSGVERDVVLCAATGQSHAEILENLSATLNCTSEQPIIAKRNCLTPWDVQSRRIHGDGGAWPTLYGEQGGGHGYAAQLQQPPLGAHCLNPWDTQESRVFMEDGVSPTMAGADGGGGRNPVGLLLKLADSPPVAAFCGGASAEARSIGYSEKVSPTLKAEAGGFTAPCVCEPLTARTLTARGDGSPNVDSGPNVVAYGITSQSANSMRSSNPHSGIYEADASKTLDTSGVNPSANQGGIAVVNRQPALTMRLREGCEGGGKGPLLQNEMSGALATGNDQYLFSPCAVGVHQNQAGDVNVSETAYTLATNSNATGRNAPLVAHEQATAAGVISKGDGDCFITPEFHGALSCGGGMPGQGYPAALVPRSEIPLDVHPDVAGTLCASGAGLSRPAGMASEPDLCVAYALAGNMIGRQDCNGPQGSGVREEASFTLNATDIQGVATINASGEPIPIHDRATRCQGGGDTRNGDGCGNGLGVGKPGDPAPTLLTGDHHMVAAVFNREYSSVFKEASVVGTQTARQCKDETALVCDCGVSAVDCRNYKEIGDCSGTLQAKDKPGYSLNYQNPVKVPVNGARYIVRRLTPTECERLQGYPDGWTKFGHDGKEISDTRRYQMLGNSICVPVVAFVLGSIAAQIHNEGRDEND